MSMALPAAAAAALSSTAGNPATNFISMSRWFPVQKEV
jgi:hypothetical protein